MPKRSQEKDQEILGQIYDFIFREAKKRPNKRKPIKVSGIDGKDLLTDGIVAALEKPGVFITSQAVKDFQDSLDITLTKIRPDENNPAVTMKVATSSLIDIIKDPMGFAQKAKDKADAARKDGKAKFMGTLMRGFIANGWATEYADIDTQLAVRNGLTAIQDIERSSEFKYKNDRWRIKAGIGQSASGRAATDSSSLSSMQERAGTLIGKSIFTEQGWHSLTEAQRTRIGTILGMGHKVVEKGKSFKPGDASYLSTSQYVMDQLKDVLTSSDYGFNYSENDAKVILDRYYDTVNTHKNPQDGSISLTDSIFYRKLELSNLNSRISQLESQRLEVSDTERDKIDDQIMTLKRAGLIISGQSLDKDSLKAARDFLHDQIAVLKSQISSENDISKRAALNRRLKEAKKGSRSLDSLVFWNTVGQIEGIYSSIQNLASGSLLTDIISGDFFDPNRNTYFCPNKSIKSQFGVNFYVPKVVTNNGRVNQLATSYNSALVNLYYLTPKSIMKTFFQNGEGFAYLSFLQNKSISSLLKGSIGEDGFSLLKNLTLANGNSILNDGGLSNEGIQALLENGSTGIITQILDNSGLQGEARVLLQKQLQKKFRSIVSLNKCHRFFSINARFKDLISKKIEGFMKKRREKLVQSLMKSKFFAKLFKEGAGKLLGQWAEKGGLQTIARALVLAAANALGIALSGGLANILVTGLSILVADALFAMGKLLLGMVVFAIFGIIGIGFLVFGKNNTFNQNTYTYASTPPGEVYVNPNFTGTSPITGEDDEHEIGDFVGGTLPDGEKCLLGSSSYRCTQGPYGSYSHANVAAVDVTGTDSFYAPTFCGKDNCVVTYSGSAYCSNGYAGGMVKFTATYGGSTYEFTLIHVNTTYGVGTKLSAGQKVARVMTYQETTGACSSGEHLHIQTKVNGTVVNPWEVLTKGSSSGGFGCNIGSCPVD